MVLYNQHTPNCIASTAQREFAIHWFLTAFPDYCETCGGVGEIVNSYDPSPAGVSLGGGCMYDADPCPDCSENGLCPHCGNVLDDDAWEKELKCPYCGFDCSCDGDNSSIPYADDDCGCWYYGYYEDKAKGYVKKTKPKVTSSR